MLLWVEECKTINKRKYDLCDVNHILGFNVMSKQLHIVCILYPGLLGNCTSSHCCDSLNQFHYSFGYIIPQPVLYHVHYVILEAFHWMNGGVQYTYVDNSLHKLCMIYKIVYTKLSFS